jgi:hypothetical protein
MVLRLGVTPLIRVSIEDAVLVNQAPHQPQVATGAPLVRVGCPFSQVTDSASVHIDGVRVDLK